MDIVKPIINDAQRAAEAELPKIEEAAKSVVESGLLKEDSLIRGILDDYTIEVSFKRKVKDG